MRTDDQQRPVLPIVELLLKVGNLHITGQTWTGTEEAPLRICRIHQVVMIWTPDDQLQWPPLDATAANTMFDELTWDATGRRAAVQVWSIDEITPDIEAAHPGFTDLVRWVDHTVNGPRRAAAKR